MKSRLRIFCVLVIVGLLLSTSRPAAGLSSLMNSTAIFTSLDFVANIETIGVTVSGTGLSPNAELVYRQSGQVDWHTGHPLIRMDDGRLVGSLFNLAAATSYEVKVLDGASEISGSISTQPDQLSFTPSNILHVDDNALPGGDGSAAAPFHTIQEAVDQAGPGTQVLVADGLYREAVTFPRSGMAGNWIQIKAAGSAAILDSADRLTGSIWTSTSTAKVWFTKIGGPVAYLARGTTRFYQYDDKNGLMQAKGHGGITINEGWYYEAGTQRLYVRSLDNPVNYAWRLPRLNHAFDIGARGWIWIEGFEIRFYGTTTNGCGVCTLNASHIVIRKNKIHNMQLGIFVNWNGTVDQGNDARIEGNEVYDPLVNEWPWGAVKGSYMEGTGIIIRGHIGAIVRDNNVHNFFNGIYTGSSGALENSELAFDADIYNNYVHHVSDDGFEPEGACINQRFRNNTVDRSFIGISIAPITQGPTWVLRNTFANFTGRGIKFADDSDGIVLIYHNTGWTSAANINGADLITSIHNVKMRNNIFQITGYSFYEVPTGSTANDWNYDNWYTTRGSAGPHFKWENVNYNTISALCASTGLECKGYETAPGFINPAGGDFTLLSSSPNIDRGVVIPGINDDFLGNAPDVGAYEFLSGPPPTVVSSVRADSNPTSAPVVNFKVTFSEPVTGVDLSAPFNDFHLTVSALTGAAINDVTPLSSSIYMVSVSAGVGVGTLRLDVVDDNSIQDAANRPLGGSAIGDGNFTSGETYTVNRPPNVDVTIGGNLQESYSLIQFESTRDSYAIDSGPVKVASTNGIPVLTSERFLYSYQNSKSYAEMMGYPGNQLATEYWFPWYNNLSYSTQLRVSNMGANSAEVKVYAGSSTTPIDTFTLQAGQGSRTSYPVDNGPLHVISTDGITPILASERFIQTYLDSASYSEMMGYPGDQLATEYWFPWYNNISYSTQLRVSNMGSISAEVKVYAGNSATPIDTFTLSAGEGKRVSYTGLDSGPLHVVSTDGVTAILASERFIQTFGTSASYAEMMGYPGNQLATGYCFPWYNNISDGTVALSTQLRISNMATSGTAQMKVYLAGSEIDSFSLNGGEGRRVSYPSLNNGLLCVVSTDGTTPILASERFISTYLNSSSYSEMMGYPTNQLANSYWFPWYNNLSYSTELRIAKP